MNLAHAHAGVAGPSTAIRKFMDRQISSDDYFRQVREETSREVDDDLKKKSTKEGDGR